MVPLAAYLLVVGLVNLRPRPLVTSGASDTMALGFGILGLVFVGPIELFRPEFSTVQFMNYIWIVLIVFYLLSVSLAALISRPRLVIYNMTAERLRPLLTEAAGKVDANFRWAGDSLLLPREGVQLHVDSFPLLRNVSLVSSGPNQSLDGWRKLTKQLRVALRSSRSAPQPPAVAMVLVAIALLLVCEWRLAGADVEVAEALGELLSFGWERG